MRTPPKTPTALAPWHSAASRRVRLLEGFVTLGVLLHLTSGLLHALGLI